MRILCAGDLHIGRSASRLFGNVEPRSVSAAAAWTRIVDTAIARRVDLVALSGDLVDKDNAYFEAIGPLEAGVRRLGEAGIPTVAVAGNHDWSVLPELGRALPAEYCRLLGADGKWERHLVVAASGERLYVDGWSFRAEHVRENPMHTYALGPADAPVLGLLHTDLGATASSYAGTAMHDLHRHPVQMWLLGHIHTPGIRSTQGAPVVLYPGSPQALDPGEPGVHGAWVVQMSPAGVTHIELVPLASARYERLAVDVTGAATTDELRQRLTAAVRSAGQTAAGTSSPLRHLSLRVDVVGSTPLHRTVARQVAAMADDLSLAVQDVAVCVERVEVRTRPAYDLAQLAKGPEDAVAVLAQLIQELEVGRPLDERPELARLVRAVPEALVTAKPYRGLPDLPGEFDDAALCTELASQATLLLDELLLQKETAQ